MPNPGQQYANEFRWIIYPCGSGNAVCLCFFELEECSMTRLSRMMLLAWGSLELNKALLCVLRRVNFGIASAVHVHVSRTAPDFIQTLKYKLPQ
jgi:hypothetical protein